MEPLLAYRENADPAKLTYPVYVSPKIDGVRCWTHLDENIPGYQSVAAYSRTMKPIRNDYIRTTIQSLGVPYLDGELWIPGAKNFGEVSAIVMAKEAEGQERFEYHVFDNFKDPSLPFTTREGRLFDDCPPGACPSWMRAVPQVTVHTQGALENYEEWAIGAGYEGIMIRRPDGHYKFGRSGKKEALLLKLKRFEDSEAEVIGLEQEMENLNPQTRNAAGRSERSGHQTNMRGKGTLGALVCRTPEGVEFKIGTGFTAEQRRQLWEARALIGQLVKYKHQPHGAKDAPRCPVFLGLRSREDV